MSIIVQVSQLGQACLPQKYAYGLHTGPTRLFTPHKDIVNQCCRFLRNGGAVVLNGSWQDVSGLAQALSTYENELIPHLKDARARKQALRELRQRLLTTADSLPGELIPSGELAGLLGETELPALPVLLPIEEAARLTANGAALFHVEALGVNLLTHPDVLTPRSGETIELMCKAIDSVAVGLPDKPQVLDMGCGSGVLSIAAAIRLDRHYAAVTAADILPEALALTRLNVNRLENAGQCPANRVTTTVAGDLFQPLSEQRFDLIMFNAPWVAAPAHNRAELALNDHSQSTIRRFLESCPQHLHLGGRVIVGYADNSGPKAIARLEQFISDSGLQVVDVLKDRIKTYRSQRPWQNVYAYVLETAQ